MLNKHAPLRKKFIKANHPPYITKTLRKVTICWSQLETKYLKTEIFKIRIEKNSQIMWWFWFIWRAKHFFEDAVRLLNVKPYEY